MRGFRIFLLFSYILPFLAFGGMVLNGHPVNSLPLAPDERAALAKGAAGAQVHHFPHPAGHRELAVLLVDFSDAPADFTPAEVDSLLNQPGYAKYGNRGSVHDFYLDVSNGKLDLHYQIYGYYRAKMTKKHYEGVGNWTGGEELLKETIKALDGEIDYTKLGSGTGEMNSIALLYAGEEHLDLHEATTWIRFFADGRSVGRAYYAGLGKSSLEIARFSRNMGFVLFDWPVVDFLPNSAGGLGAGCLMGDYLDLHNPVPPNEVLRADQGWLKTTDLAAESRGVYPVAANGAQIYRLLNPARPDDEGFYIVNRENTGRYASLGGKGLLVYHVDFPWNDSSGKAPIILVDDKGKIKPPASWPEPARYFSAANMDEFSYAAQGGDNDWHDGTRSGIRLHSISAPRDTMGFSMGDGAVALGARPSGPSQAGSFRFRADGSRLSPRPQGTPSPSVKSFSR